MYRFIREDDGFVIEVDFETMMGQDVAGYITLDDGVQARRVMDVENKRPTIERGNANRTPPSSDALGFTAHQLWEFEEDRRRNGFSGVEFKPDPSCPEFYQVHFSSHGERDRYMQHRNFVDKNYTKGNPLSAKDLDAAREWAERVF